MFKLTLDQKIQKAWQECDHNVGFAPHRVKMKSVWFILFKWKTASEYGGVKPFQNKMFLEEKQQTCMNIVDRSLFFKSAAWSFVKTFFKHSWDGKVNEKAAKTVE